MIDDWEHEWTTSLEFWLTLSPLSSQSGEWRRKKERGACVQWLHVFTHHLLKNCPFSLSLYNQNQTPANAMSECSSPGEIVLLSLSSKICHSLKLKTKTKTKNLSILRFLSHPRFSHLSLFLLSHALIPLFLPSFSLSLSSLTLQFQFYYLIYFQIFAYFPRFREFLLFFFFNTSTLVAKLTMKELIFCLNSFCRFFGLFAVIYGWFIF